MSHWWYQEHRYIEVWFEAQAMAQQFLKYIPSGITLYPSRGDSSIPMKYEGVQRMIRLGAGREWDTTLVYFGDYDKKGVQIFDSLKEDVEYWCKHSGRSFIKVKINCIHAGLNAEQVEKYGVPEDPDNPNKYQWEALTDEQAHEIISQGVQSYVHEEGYEKANKKSKEITAAVKERMKEIQQ